MHFAEETDKLISSYTFFDEISSSCQKESPTKKDVEASPDPIFERRKVQTLHRQARNPVLFRGPPPFPGVLPNGVRVRFVAPGFGPVYMPRGYRPTFLPRPPRHVRFEV